TLEGLPPPLQGEVRDHERRPLAEDGGPRREGHHEDQIQREQDEQHRPEHPEREGHLERYLEGVVPGARADRHGAHRCTWNRATNFRYRMMNTMMIPNRIREAAAEVNGSLVGGRYLLAM